MPRQQIQWCELLPLYAVIFLGFLGFALTITLFIPMLMDRNFPLLPAEASVSLRATYSGFLLAMYPLGQFCGSPVMGHLSDHFGRKNTLIISLLACALGFSAIAFSIQYHYVHLLFFSAFFTGLCESNMAISQSIIADQTTDTVYKTKLIGYAYSSSSLGYVVGPLLGGLIGNYSIPFLITPVGVLLLTGWIYYRFYDTYMPNKNASIKLFQFLVAIKTIFNQPKFRKYYLINFLIFFSILGLYRVVPLYVQQVWSPPLYMYSFLISFVSFLCFIANLFLLNILAKRWPVKKFLSGLLIIGGLLVFLIVIPKYFNYIFLTFSLAIIPTIMALPVCTTWISFHASSREQGQVLGNNQALLVLGESTSTAIGGCLAAIFISLPTILMSIILLITGIVVMLCKDNSLTHETK